MIFLPRGRKKAEFWLIHDSLSWISWFFLPSPSFPSLWIHQKGRTSSSEGWAGLPWGLVHTQAHCFSFLGPHSWLSLTWFCPAIQCWDEGLRRVGPRLGGLNSCGTCFISRLWATLTGSASLASGVQWHWRPKPKFQSFPWHSTVFHIHVGLQNFSEG